ncbi:MAG TPA: hypothetical protein VK789_31645 [Bryobacteraceae bacterium]|jgi:hypothetical protein|nr:hypothetical protein [Bryobacteraceae bacterium]
MESGFWWKGFGLAALRRLTSTWIVGKRMLPQAMACGNGSRMIWKNGRYFSADISPNWMREHNNAVALKQFIETKLPKKKSHAQHARR